MFGECLRGDGGGTPNRISITHCFLRVIGIIVSLKYFAVTMIRTGKTTFFAASKG